MEETHEDDRRIQYLFVSEQLRGQRIGSKLLEAAEAEAKKRGCKYAFVDPFSFQAPTFYKNHGYREVFTLEEYPYTGKRHSVSGTWKGCIQHGCIYYAAAVCIDPGSIYSGWDWWSFLIAEVISFAVSVTFLVRIYQMLIKKIPNEE